MEAAEHPHRVIAISEEEVPQSLEFGPSFSRNLFSLSGKRQGIYRLVAALTRDL